MSLFGIYFVIGLIFTAGIFLQDIIFNSKAAKSLVRDPDIPVAHLIFGTIFVFSAMVIFWPYTLFINIRKAFK